MKKVVFFHNLTKYAWKSICQQLWLLAVLSVLFLALPMGAGPVARSLLSQGVAFSGITLAVTAPEGDETGEILEQLTGNMRDLRQYCSFQSLSWEDASQALDAGEVTAILVLPEDFIGGVLGGANPDLTLVVAADRPLESLLTLWVGQSAADLLTSAQRGIYAVLELYPGQEIAGQSWEQVKAQVNLDYINHTLNRQGLFRRQELQATGAMEIEIHYALSLLIFLTMALPPLLRPLFEGEGMAFRKRLRSLGHGTVLQYTSNIWVCWCILLALTAVPALYLTGGNCLGLLLLVAFAASYTALCCLASRSSAGCGGLAFLLSAGGTLLAGGIIPPALLPAPVRTIGSLLPTQILRELLYLPGEEWLDAGFALPGMLLWIAGLTVTGLILFRRRLTQKEEAL